MELRDCSMTLRDISVTLHPGTPEWPGDTPFDCRWTWKMSDGASVNLSAISGSPHVGTHADAPVHVKDGALCAHELPLSAFAGPAWVVDVRHVSNTIDYGDLHLDTATLPVERVLLRTGRSIADGTFPSEWPVLTPDCLLQLIQGGVRLVGVDCPSVDDRASQDLSNHHTIFGAGAFILENLDLRDVVPGRYELIALPLKLAGLDAAPVRAALRPYPHT